jgi:hypothetical protein
MKTLRHSTADVIGRSTMCASAVPMPSFSTAARGSLVFMLSVAALAAALAAPAWPAQSPDQAASPSPDNTVLGTDAALEPDEAAHATWRAFMAQNYPPPKGCFHASYPHIIWEKVECATVPTDVLPAHIEPTDSAGAVTGNGHDWLARLKFMQTANGTLATRGVTSEKGVGVAAFGGGGILGPNEYSLQISTNDDKTSSACARHSGCTVWQQFLYSTDLLGQGKAAVYMHYGLINWGSSGCPTGWTKIGTNCFANSPAVVAPDVPITSLGQLTLEALEICGGTDLVTFLYGTESFSVGGSNPLNLCGPWDEAEFNVVGDGGGSRAVFNKGSFITLDLAVDNGAETPTKCVLNGGTTANSNNLKLGACKAFMVGGTQPTIEFTESN